MTLVDRSGNNRPWFRRRWFKGVLFLLVSPFLLFFLSNVWLCLPWGRNWVAAKISSRLGFEARVASSSWSPWDGVRVNGLVIEQPDSLRAGVHEPLFSAESIQIWPEWRAWLQKQIVVRSLEVHSPRAVIPIQLLARLAGPARIVVAPPPAMVAAAPVEPPPEGQPAVVYQVPAAPPPPVQPPVIVTQVPPPLPAQGPSQPTGWIHVRNASIAIVSNDRSRTLFEASEFNADIPAAGNPAESFAQLGHLRILDKELAGNLTMPLRWQNPLILVGPVRGELEGVPYKMTLTVARFGNLPVNVEFQVPVKTNTTLALPGGGTASVSELRAAGRFAGLLTAPSTWQGDFMIEGVGLSATLPPRPEFKFDHGAAIVVLHGGVLSCTDGRLIGDDLSLLGNATILSDSRTAAVLRIVAGPDAAQGIANGVGRATGKRIAFNLMGTPDRIGSDLYALGNLDGINIQLGQGGDVIDGPTLLALLKAKTGESQ